MRTKHLLTTILLFTALLVYAQPKYEIRAVWLSTVSSLDWPKTEKDPQKQKEKLCEILDSLQAININTVIFQVQSRGDVLWDSEIQPASYDITKDFSKRLPYNVCDFVIEECHKRNMECHADLVPYRLGKLDFVPQYSANPVKHIYLTHPEYCDPSTRDGIWLNPGIPEVTEYLVELYKELLTKHKFDGINFDYTRYPQGGIDDEDTYWDSFTSYLEFDDWRRDNINYMVHEVYDMAKSVNPDIKVGSAPIGTYKNVKGFRNMTAYYDVWQDPCEWMQAGKHDLIVPQLYWDENFGFTPNMQTWIDNIDGRQFVAGLAAYKASDLAFSDYVIPDQITTVRNTPGAAGVSFFRTQNLIDPTNPKNVYLYNALRDEYFKYPAHIVPMAFNGVTKPNKPANAMGEYKDGVYTIKWEAPEPDPQNTPIKYYCVYASEKPAVDIEDIKNCVGFYLKSPEFSYTSDNPGLNFVVTAFDKNYYESEGTVITLVGMEDNFANSISFNFNGSEITVKSDKGISGITVYSAAGALVKDEYVNSTTVTVPCDDLSGGIYIVKVKYDNGTVSSHKIIR